MVDLILALAESDCERLRPGWLAQPVNALSSLAFVAVGVWLLGRHRRRGDASVLVAAVGVVAVGIGSFAYHGPQPGWAGAAHDASVAVLAVAVGGQTVWFLARGATRAGVVAAWRAGLPWLVVGLIAWWAGTSDSPLCHPAAVWQPHAAWHLMAAMSLAVLLGCCPALGLADVRPQRAGRPSAGAGNRRSRSRSRS